MTRLAMPAARMLDTLESFHDIGYWSFERASNSLHLSDRATVFFGDPAMPVLRSFRDLLRRVDSRDRMRLRRKFLPALREHRSFVMSLRLAPVADKARTVRLSAECRIEDGRITEVWGLIEDVTAYRASKRERRRAQRNEDRLRSAIGAMDDGFALYDKDDRLVICNEPYRNTYRESAPAIVEGARYEDILRYGVARGQYPDAIGREEEWLAECVEAHQSPSPVAFEQVLPNGRWLRGRDAKTPDGGRAGFRVDITEMKSLQRKLAMALFEARSAGQLHTSLLPNLAHEMRTPLNAIIGFSQLVPLATKLESGEEKVREYCADIEQSGRHLIEIIDNFVDVARLGAAVGQDECDTTGLDGVLERAIRLVTFFARKKGKRLEQTGEAGAVTVRGNATKMVQVILNLLSNAVKYSHQGGKVEIRVDESDLRFVKVWVIDDGPGIPADARETLFQRYERLSADRTGIPGSGLGLAIAKEFTEEMGGRIGVTEARDGGAAFWVAFRRDRPLHREQPARRASSASLREAG